MFAANVTPCESLWCESKNVNEHSSNIIIITIIIIIAIVIIIIIVIVIVITIIIISPCISNRARV